MKKKFLLLLTVTLTAIAAHANTVGDFKGGETADFGKRFRNPTADSERHHAARVNDWKVDAPGPKQTEDSDIPATSTAGIGAYGTVGGLDTGTASAGAGGSLGSLPSGRPGIIGRLLGVFGHLFGK